MEIYKLNKNEFNIGHVDDKHNIYAKYMDNDEVNIMKQCILKHWCDVTSLTSQCCALFHGAEDALKNILMYHRMKFQNIMMFNFCWDYYKQLGLCYQYNVVEIDSETDTPCCLSVKDMLLKLNDKSIVLLGLPNNPTGECLDLSVLETIIKQHTDSHFIFDCTYEEPCIFKNVFDRLYYNKNVTLIGSYSKFYGLPSLRFGFALNSNYMHIFDKYLGFNNNTFDVIYSVMNDYKYYKQNREEIHQFIENLNEYKNINIIKNGQPFVFARLNNSVNTNSMIDYIEKKTKCVLKYIVKDGATYVRISISSDPIIKKKCLEVLNMIDTYLDENK